VKLINSRSLITIPSPIPMGEGRGEGSESKATFTSVLSFQRRARKLFEEVRGGNVGSDF
jgi:hypothetical protein